MRFRRLCTVLVAVPAIAGLAAAARQDVVQKTALVTVVADARGPAAGLGPRDFVVREDRTARDVVDVRPATDPLFITLLIDTIRPPAGVLAPTQDFRRGLAAFVATIKEGNPEAQIAILDYARAAVTAIDFTSEAPTLDRYIQRLFPNRQADAVLIDAVVETATKLGNKAEPAPGDRRGRFQLARRERGSGQANSGGNSPRIRPHTCGRGPGPGKSGLPPPFQEEIPHPVPPVQGGGTPL